MVWKLVWWGLMVGEEESEIDGTLAIIFNALVMWSVSQTQQVNFL